MSVNTLARLPGGRQHPEQKTTLYRNVILPAIAYASPLWWDELHPVCRLKSLIVSIQKSVLLHLSDAFHTRRTATLQVILRAPPIVLESEQLNAEFHLFALRKMTRYGDLIVRPDEITYLADRLEIHPVEGHLQDLKLQDGVWSGYLTTEDDVKQLERSLAAANVNFSVRTSPRKPGNIVFNSANGGVPIYVDLVPFRVTGDTTKQCIFGDEYNKTSNAKHQDEPAAHWQGIKKKRLLLQGTEKKGCKATMNLKYIKLYQEHKVRGSPTKNCSSLKPLQKRSLRC
ncbi:hypothetical protein MRX96_029030 [Rhipicephalus microplus]